MSAEPQRRSLINIPRQQPAAVPSEAAIAEVANRNGFQAVPAAPKPAPVVESGQETPRRQRQPKGRDHQFNTRLRRDTLDFIYAQSNDRNIPIAQVIEEMAEALKRQQGG